MLINNNYMYIHVMWYRFLDNNLNFQYFHLFESRSRNFFFFFLFRFVLLYRRSINNIQPVNRVGVFKKIYIYVFTLLNKN